MYILYIHIHSVVIGIDDARHTECSNLTEVR